MTTTRIETKTYAKGVATYRNKMGRATSVNILREHTDLYEKDTSVTMMTSNLLHGVTSGGKNWYRWERHSSRTLKVAPIKSGAVRANVLEYRPRMGFVNMTPFYFTYESWFDGPAGTALRSLLERTLPKHRFDAWVSDQEPLYSLFYPGYSAVSFDTLPENMDPLLRRAMREETAMDITLALFGKRHYRKDLVKAVTQTLYNNLETAYFLRSVLKTDWLVEILRSEEALSLCCSSANNNHRRALQVLKTIPEHRRRRFVLSLANHNYYFIRDSFIQGADIEPARVAGVRNVGDLHDLVVAENPAPRYRYGGWTQPEPEEIPLNVVTELYDGVSTGSGLKIVAPRHTTVTDEWSSAMNNCIRGYGHNAVVGQTNLGGVYNGDTLVANFEIGPDKKLRQLLGKYNQHLAIGMQHDILDALEECGAIEGSTSGAWGVDTLDAR